MERLGVGSPELISLIITVMSSGIAGALAFLLSVRRQRRLKQALRDGGNYGAVLIFRDHDLEDANEAGLKLLRTGPLTGSDYQRFVSNLSEQYPRFTEELKSLADARKHGVTSVDPADGSIMRAEKWGDLLRIELHEQRVPGTPEKGVDARMAAEHAPWLTWKQDVAGNVTWANKAYREQLAGSEHEPRISGQTLPKVFPEIEGPISEDVAKVVSVPGNNDGGTRSYECRFSKGYWYAHPIEELSLQDRPDTILNQALTRTFTHMPIGLALFDESRLLKMFNPAFASLTGLEVDFLESTPALSVILDALRSRRMIPEPRDYRSWRDEILSLDPEVERGYYEGTWHLSSGRTYKVTGRACLDQTMILQLEDITAEISMTRHFRSEIETTQSMIDTLPQAIAVFNANGTLTISNKAYAELWNHDPGASIGEVTTADALNQWMSECARESSWDRIATSLKRLRGRNRVEEMIRHQSGAIIRVDVARLSGGASMVSFSTHSSRSEDQSTQLETESVDG